MTPACHESWLITSSCQFRHYANAFTHTRTHIVTNHHTSNSLDVKLVPYSVQCFKLFFYSQYIVLLNTTMQCLCWSICCSYANWHRLYCWNVFILLPAAISVVNLPPLHDQLQPTSPAPATSTSVPNIRQSKAISHRHTADTAQQ